MFFKQKVSQTIKVYVEGETKHQGDKRWLELRVDSPDYRRINKTDWELTIDVDVLCSVDRREDKSIYRLNILNGEAVSVLSQIIPIYDRTGTLLGCLKLIGGPNQGLTSKKNYLVDEDLKLDQGTVMAKYSMEITI